MGMWNKLVTKAGQYAKNMREGLSRENMNKTKASVSGALREYRGNIVDGFSTENMRETATAGNIRATAGNISKRFRSAGEGELPVARAVGDPTTVESPFLNAEVLRAGQDAVSAGVTTTGQKPPAYKEAMNPDTAGMQPSKNNGATR